MGKINEGRLRVNFMGEVGEEEEDGGGAVLGAEGAAELSAESSRRRHNQLKSQLLSIKLRAAPARMKTMTVLPRSLHPNSHVLLPRLQRFPLQLPPKQSQR
jgi:hypothetical protein